MNFYSIEEIKEDIQEQKIVVDTFSRDIGVTPMTMYKILGSNTEKTIDDVSLKIYKAIVQQLFGKQYFYDIDDIKKKTKEKKMNARQLSSEIGISHTTIYGLFSGRQKLENKRTGTYKAIVNFLWKEV